jgi:L-fucose mutarotase/ribose pyranase (RbsD/FucU family)
MTASSPFASGAAVYGRELSMWEIVGICAAQLIAGYIGSHNDNTAVGQAALSYEKIMDIVSKIDSIEAEIQNVIKAIAEAVERIERARLDDEMQGFHTKMISDCSAIEDKLKALSGLSAAENNKDNATVQECVIALNERMASVHEAIMQFARLDSPPGKPPTLQTYFSCSASVGMWARAYQMVNVYNPTSPPIYQSAESQQLQNIYMPFFADVDRIVTENESALYGPLLIPKGIVCKFVSDHFENWSGPVTRGAYQCEIAGPGQEPTVLNVYTGIGHRPWVPERPNAPAAQVFSSLLQRRVPFVQRLSDYRPVLESAAKSMSAFNGTLSRRHT